MAGPAPRTSVSAAPATTVAQPAAPAITPARAAAPSRQSAIAQSGAPAVRLGSVSSNAPGLSGGEPLPAIVQAPLEHSFQANLQGVRVHTDAHAQATAANLSARAFTYGNHIFLGPGEQATDLGLMAHESAHVIQQQSAPTVQLSAAGQSDAYEREADRASVAVSHGEQFNVSEQVHAPKVQRWGISDAFNFFADRANLIPGFRLFTLIIGVNPINMRRVERSAANILRALVEFMPGGGLIVMALDQFGIFDQVGGWIEEQMGTLGLTGSAIRSAVSQFIDSLSLLDLGRLGSVWERAQRIFTEPIERIKSLARRVVPEVLTFVKNAILRPLARLAEGTRGYDLLKAVLGQDPITGEPVPRNAETLIGGFMKLIGQEEVWNNLKRANAVPRAWAWFQGALNGLMGYVRQIPSLFISALQQLEISDLVLVPRAFSKITRVFGGFVGDFLSWAGAQVMSLLEIIFEVVAPSTMTYIRRAAGAFRTIIQNPIGFIGNLVRAGIQGFRQFAGNFLTHLRTSLISWLTGTMSGASIYIPQAFNLREIIKFVLSVLGLTWQNIRGKLVRAIGEPAVRALETGFDIVMTLVREGPAAAWQKIMEGITNLREMVMEQIMNFVRDRVVQAAITRLLTSLNPAGAFIQAIIAIYNTIMFFVERLRQISQVAMSFIDSIAAIAAGTLGPAADRVERTMAGLLTLVISFLARIAGLGRVSDAVLNIVNRVRAPIDRALDRVVNWIVAQARRLGRLLVSRRQAGQGGADTAVRREVRTALMRDIGQEATLEHVQSVVRSIRQQFTTRGLRRIEIGRPNAQGSREILVEASPFTAELLLELAQARDSVNLVATVRFHTPQTVELSTRPTRVQDPNNPNNILSASYQLGVTVVSPTTQPRPASVSREPSRETIQTDTFQAVAYNTPGSAHAEANFIAWFNRTFPGRAAQDIDSIDIHLSHSPCRNCCHDTLNNFRNSLPSRIGTGRPLPTLRLHYRRPHTTGANPTTVEDLQRLSGGSPMFQITADQPVTLTDAQRNRDDVKRVRARFVRG